jgi:hypothetical protein
MTGAHATLGWQVQVMTMIVAKSLSQKDNAAALTVESFASAKDNAKKVPILGIEPRIFSLRSSIRVRRCTTKPNGQPLLYFLNGRNDITSFE